MAYSGHSLEGLTPLQRCDRCILLPKPTELHVFAKENSELKWAVRPLKIDPGYILPGVKGLGKYILIGNIVYEKLKSC